MGDLVRGFAYSPSDGKTYGVSDDGPIIYKVNVAKGKLFVKVDYSEKFDGYFTGITVGNYKNDPNWLLVSALRVPDGYTLPPEAWISKYTTLPPDVNLNVLYFHELYYIKTKNTLTYPIFHGIIAGNKEDVSGLTSGERKELYAVTFEEFGKTRENVFICLEGIRTSFLFLLSRPKCHAFALFLLHR